MSTPLHPALVHLPLGLSLIAPLVLLAVLLGHRRFGWPRSTLVLPIVLQVILFAGAMLSMRTGEEEEERVEDRVPHAAIEEHEELASAFTWSAGGVLVVLAVGMLLSAGRARSTLLAIAGAGSLVVGGLGIAAGHAGGELVYVHGAANTAAGAVGAQQQHGDDDDR